MKKIHYLVIITVLSFLQYGNTLKHDFAYDDEMVIVKNPYVQQGIKGIPSLFANVYDYKGNGLFKIYRPVSYATHALEWQFFGANPQIGHFFNIVYFIIACVLAFFLIKKISNNSLLALTVVILFIVHPIHTEVVANIKGRDDILGLIGGLGSVLLFIKYVENQSIHYFFVSILVFVLGLFAKANIITFLGLIPLCLYYTFTNKKLWERKYAITKLWGVLLLIGIVFLFIRIQITGAIPNSQSISLANPLFMTDSWSVKSATIFGILGKYMQLLCWPYPLVYYYGFNNAPLMNWSDYQVVLPFIFCVIAVFYAILLFKNKNIFSFLVFWCLCSLSVYLHIIPAPVIMAERFLFVPSLAFCWAIVWGLGKVTKLDWKRVQDLTHIKNYKFFIGIFSVISILFFALTFERNKDWKDTFTLLKADIPHLQQAVMPHNHMANALAKAYKDKTINLSEAAFHQQMMNWHQKAIQLYPKHVRSYVELAVVYKELNDQANFLTNLKKALQLAPNNAKANYLMGEHYYQQKDFVKAIPYLETAFQKHYQQQQLYHYLARAYCRKEQATINDFKRANEVLQTALKKYKNNVEIIKDISRVYLMAGNHSIALQFMQQAYQIAPNDVEVLTEISQLYELLGDDKNAAIFKAKYLDIR